MNETLLVAAIIVAGVFVAVNFFNLLHKRQRNKEIEKRNTILADTVWKNKLEIAVQERIHEYLLAVDKVNFVLVYISFNNEGEEVKLIDLWKVNAVKVTTEGNIIYKQRKGKSVLVEGEINKLQLEVTLTDATEKINLVLHQYKDGVHDIALIKQRADYWCKLINSAVKKLSCPSGQCSGYA